MKPKTVRPSCWRSNPWSVRESAAVISDFPDKGFALLVVVVEMHFHIANAQTHHFGDAVEQVAPVLLLWVKEAVLRALSSRVPWSVIGNARPFVAPLRHPAERGFNGCAHAQRFVMIGDRNPGALWLCGSQAFPQPVLQIRPEPDFRVSRELHGVDLPLCIFFEFSLMLPLQMQLPVLVSRKV